MGTLKITRGENFGKFLKDLGKMFEHFRLRPKPIVLYDTFS